MTAGRPVTGRNEPERDETVVPVLFDAAGNPAFFAATGEFTGTVSGVEEERQDERK
jgi:hypothetical protein